MDNLNAVRSRLPNIMDVQKLLAKRLIGTKFGRNVIAVGIGNKIINFETDAGDKKVVDTGVPAVRVYVSRKLEADEIGSGLTLPKELLQVPVDVIKVKSDFRVQPGFGAPSKRPGVAARSGRVHRP